MYAYRTYIRSNKSNSTKTTKGLGLKEHLLLWNNNGNHYSRVVCFRCRYMETLTPLNL